MCSGGQFLSVLIEAFYNSGARLAVRRWRFLTDRVRKKSRLKASKNAKNDEHVRKQREVYSGCFSIKLCFSTCFCITDATHLKCRNNAVLCWNILSIPHPAFAHFRRFSRLWRDFSGTLVISVCTWASKKRQKNTNNFVVYSECFSIKARFRALTFNLRFFTFFFIFRLFPQRSLGGRCGDFWALFSWFLMPTLGSVWSRFSSVWALLGGFLAISERSGWFSVCLFFANVSDFQSHLEAKNGRVMNTPLSDNPWTAVTTPWFSASCAFCCYAVFGIFFIRFFYRF